MTINNIINQWRLKLNIQVLKNTQSIQKELFFLIIDEQNKHPFYILIFI